MNKYDPILGEYRQADYPRLLATAPSNPKDGYTYINTLDHGLYIFYGGMWNLLHTLDTQYLLLETGDVMLMETGDKLVV